MTSPALGLLFGLINTTALHVAKGMQRQGIRTLRWWRLPKEERSGKMAFIYLAGVTLNNSTPLWLILANRFAAPAYATGMFGVGLVLLLLYSSLVLKESVLLINYLGAVVVVAGTVLFSIHALSSADLDIAQMDRVRVSLFASVYLAVTLVALLLLFRSSNGRVVGLVFGLFAGGAASLDPILKSIGQTASGSAAFIPREGWGWAPFGLSFALGVAAFLSVQWAFLRGAQASVFVPFHSSVYVLVPVLVQLIALPGYEATPALIVGVTCIVAGIILMQIRHTLEAP